MHEEEQPKKEPEADADLVGGEVQIGTGGAPAFLRWMNYGLFVWAILYLVILRPENHPVVLFFAVLLSVWLVYIFVGRKPAEL